MTREWPPRNRPPHAAPPSAAAATHRSVNAARAALVLSVLHDSGGRRPLHSQFWRKVGLVGKPFEQLLDQLCRGGQVELEVTQLGVDVVLPTT